LNLEAPRTIIVQKNTAVPSVADFVFTYEYGWQNTSHNDITIQINLPQVNTIPANQCSWTGSISFFPHKAGGEAKNEGN
jgi:hypothetical protein